MIAPPSDAAPTGNRHTASAATGPSARIADNAAGHAPEPSGTAGAERRGTAVTTIARDRTGVADDDRKSVGVLGAGSEAQPPAISASAAVAGYPAAPTASTTGTARGGSTGTGHRPAAAGSAGPAITEKPGAAAAAPGTADGRPEDCPCGATVAAGPAIARQQTALATRASVRTVYVGPGRLISTRAARAPATDQPGATTGTAIGGE